MEKVYIILTRYPGGVYTPYNYIAFISEDDAKEEYQKAIYNCKINNTSFWLKEFEIKN